MSATLTHRGPDDGGEWADESAALGLGHRRLSILDLSPDGHQPMVSSCGRFVISYNGEVYNFLAMRKDLEREGRSFRSQCDTEVLVEGAAQWGIEETLRRAYGMFALALWDRRDRRLWLARDRLGIKPLYYGLMNGVLLFGSELKALRAHPAFSAQLNRAALAAYLRFNVVPSPECIWEGVRQLPPGTILSLNDPREQSTPRAFWSAVEVARHARDEGMGAASGDLGAMTDALEDELTRAVQKRLVADVPLGAFLSGGVDSSTVVALMQKVSTSAVKTFTIGFEEAGYDEAADAARVAAHLGTEHTSWMVTPDDARSLIPRLPTLYDEPFADSSQIPTFLVSQLAREHVTVALSGDGGDELFAGYNRHHWAPTLWRYLAPFPTSLRRAGAAALQAVTPARWDHLFGALDSYLPARFRARTPGDKLHKLAGMLAAEGPDQVYRALVSHWTNPVAMVRGADHEAARAVPPLDDLDFTERMMLTDLLTYLPDDILTKVDRASMGVALEVRVPMIDHDVVALAWRLPLDVKLRGGVSKWILREVLARHVPRSLFERPKQGFGMPIDAWLRGPLRGWAAELLHPERLRQEGVFDPAPITQAWDAHLSGRRNLQHPLWDVLMFQAWYEANGRPDIAEPRELGTTTPLLARA